MKYNDIALNIHRTVCSVCGTVFEEPLLSEFQYGEQLIHTTDGLGFVYVSYVDNPAVREIRRLIGDVPNEAAARRRLRRAVVAAADATSELILDPDRMGLSCPECGSEELHTEVVPLKTAKLTVPILTFEGWLSLCDEEKRAIVKKVADDPGG